MAKGNAELNTAEAVEAPFGLKPDGTPRKRAATEGPRKTKPLHMAVEVTDANGQPIHGAVVKPHKVSKDFETIYGHLEQNPHLSRVRVPLDNIAD